MDDPNKNPNGGEDAAAKAAADKAAADKAAADKAAAAKPAKADAPAAPAWQGRDYSGPLTGDQAAWRNANIKPAAARTK